MFLRWNLFVFKVQVLQPIVYFAGEDLIFYVATHPQNNLNINILSTDKTKVKHGLPELIENAILFIFSPALQKFLGTIVNILLFCSQCCFYARRLKSKTACSISRSRRCKTRKVFSGTDNCFQGTVNCFCSRDHYLTWKRAEIRS